MCFNLIGKENSDLSVYAQLPQDICTSIAQLFALLAVFEFIYLAAPRSARSLFVGLYFFSRQVGSYSGYTADMILDQKNITLNFQVGIRLNKFLFIYFSHEIASVRLQKFSTFHDTLPSSSFLLVFN